MSGTASEGEGAPVAEAYPAGVPQSSAFQPPPAISPTFLGLVEYEPIWRAMQRFTAERTAETPDELWLVQHPPVFTQGQAGKPEHLLHLTDIPVVQIDRGGQVTYHGPGQIVAYLLLDLRRWRINVRDLVRLMENSVIQLLAGYGVTAAGRDDAPGVYVHAAKIASLGLKIRNGCCYHGLAFNVEMDLSPFACINPCGYAGLRVTQARDVGVSATLPQLEQQLAQILTELLRRHRLAVEAVSASTA